MGGNREGNGRSDAGAGIEARGGGVGDGQVVFFVGAGLEKAHVAENEGHAVADVKGERGEFGPGNLGLDHAAVFEAAEDDAAEVAGGKDVPHSARRALPPMSSR